MSRYLLLFVVVLLLFAAGYGEAAYVYWRGTVGGDWSTASNWSSYPSLPGSSDDALISITGGTWIITHNSGIHSVASLQCDEIFNLAGGTLNISSASQCPTGFLFSGGTFGGVSSLTVGGSGGWTAGSIGTASYTNGVISNGTWDISGAGTKTLISALTNNGTMTQSGAIDIKNGGVLANNSGKTYEIKADVGVTNSAGSARIDNRGIFRKSTTGGTTDIVPVFNNSGTLDVPIGTVRLWGGGDFTGGKVTCNSSANGIQFEGGTYTMGNECSIGGFGKGVLDSATFTVPTGNNLYLELNNGFTLNSGILTGSGGQIYSRKNLDWWSTSISALNNLRNESTLTIYGTNSHTFQSSQIGNYGTIYHMGVGNLTFSQGSQFHNISGEYLLYSDASFASSDGTGTFINNSSLKKAYSNGTSRIDTQLTNYGSIQVDTGTLALYGGGTFNGGSVGVANPSYITFNQGQYTINADVSFSGSGYANMAGGTISYGPGKKTTYNLGDGMVLLTGSSFTGQGVLVNSGKASWQVGTFSGGAILENRGTLTLASYTAKNLQGAALDNFKDVLQAGASGPNVDGASTLTCANGSSYEFQADSGITGTGVITNGGTFRKTYSTGETLIEPTFNNQYGGFDIDGGTMKLTGGGTWYDGGANMMAGSALTLANGTWTLNGAFGAAGSGNMNFASGIVNLAAGAQASFLLDQGLHLSGATVNGPGSLINNSNADWSGGSFASAARLTNQGTLSLIGTGVKTLRASMMFNPQTTRQTGTGALDFKEKSTLDNAGTYQLLADASLTCTDGGSLVSNGGTFGKYSSSGVSSVQPTLANYGLIDAHSGTIRLSGGSELYDSAATIYAGAHLDFTGGTHRVHGRFAVSGSGSSLLATNMVVDLGASAEFDLEGGFHFVDGTISGTGSVVNKGVGDWTNGYIVEDGTLTNYGTFNILAGANRGLRRGHLLTLGTVNHQEDGLDVDERSTLEIAASGTYNLMNNSLITGLGLIKNDGIFRKYNGLRESTVANPIDNTRGTVESASGALILTGRIMQVEGSVLTGGTWVVDDNSALEIATSDFLLTNRGTVVLGANSSFRQIERMLTNEGTFRLLNGRGFTCTKQFTNTGTLELVGGDFNCGKIVNTGTWKGYGTILGGILSSGTVEPAVGDGFLALTGAYTQQDTGTLKVTLNGYEDALCGKIIANSAVLAGALRIELAAGFTPVKGQKFVIVDANLRSGQFKTLILPALSGGLTFNPIYTSSGLTLVVGYPMSTPSEVSSVVEARGRELNTYISLPAIVSAVFSDNTFFVQDAGRIAGMRVVCGDAAPVVGEKIQVAGLLYPDNACLSLISAQWVPYSWNIIDPPAPLFIAQKYVGGATLGQQIGVLNAYGLNNVGLLVKAAGTVTYIQQYKFAYIDDGSGIVDGNTLVSGKAAKGVRVIFPPNTTIPSSTARMIVTGISCRYYINGYPQRAILARSREDIAVY